MAKMSNRPTGVYMVIGCLLVLACGFLLAIVIFQVYPRLTLVTPATSPPDLELLVQLLIERVGDGLAYINTFLVVMGLIVTLLTIALGLSIWEARKHVQNLLAQHLAQLVGL